MLLNPNLPSCFLFFIKSFPIFFFSAFTSEEKNGLASHDKFRKVHQVPLMRLDKEMCNQAKAYAQKIAKMGKLVHSPGKERPGQGENLSMGCSTHKAQAVEEAVASW